MVGLIAVCLTAVSCAAPRTGVPRVHRREWTWAEPRQAYIRRSQVWLGGDLEGWLSHLRSLDLLAGPSRYDGFAPEALVRCTFVEAHPGLTGATPKFLCRVATHPNDARGAQPAAEARDDTLMVKWGADSGEVYAEVASTRLLWALGFAADAVYPVRVECSDCADDPWRDPHPHIDHLPPVFAPAIIEKKFPGRTIEERPDQGWTWDDLNRVDAAVGGAPRMHVDALRLLAAFIQHRDNKAENQRLVCLADGETITPDGRRTCVWPFMLIGDLGSTFGGPAHLFSHKMTLDAWRHEPVWKVPRRCIANLDDEPATRGGLEEPQIGEPGRRFLAALLGALDDAQLTALFTAARAGQRGGVAEWVAVFKERRRQIEEPIAEDLAFRCPP